MSGKLFCLIPKKNLQSIHFQRLGEVMWEGQRQRNDTTSTHMATNEAKDQKNLENTGTNQDKRCSQNWYLSFVHFEHARINFFPCLHGTDIP